MLGKIARTIIPAGMRPIGYLTNQAFKGSQGAVRAGPFKGMKYIRSSAGSCYIPKLLGIYERELYPLVEDAIKTQHDLIIDIGAAEGYYAVGLAMRCPSARVIGYELEPKSQEKLKEMVTINKQDRLEIRGGCE